MKVLVTISGRLYCKVIFKIVSFLEEHEDGFIYDSFFTPTIFVAIFLGSLPFSFTISANPVLKVNALFYFMYIYTSVYLKTSEKKTPTDPNKISAEIFSNL